MFGDSATPNLSMFAGGPETVRGFSQSPYLNGPDGIGSPHSGVVQFAFADGSVRAISVDVDEKILEALATIRGGEVVGDF
jgi:prepilin-type processing-associated H-X9-DG protein